MINTVVKVREIEVTVSYAVYGKYYAQTEVDPAEYPEVEVLSWIANVDDPYDIEFLTTQEFKDELHQAVLEKEESEAFNQC